MPVKMETCRKCGESGPNLDEFLSPYNGLCAKCQPSPIEQAAEALTPIQPKCEKCRFYLKSDFGKNEGFCHRYPPQWTVDFDSPMFPLISNISWCGEFQPLSPYTENQ